MESHIFIVVLNAVMLSGITLSVVMLSVVALSSSASSGLTYPLESAHVAPHQKLYKPVSTGLAPGGVGTSKSSID